RLRLFNLNGFPDGVSACHSAASIRRSGSMDTVRCLARHPPHDLVELRIGSGQSCLRNSLRASWSLSPSVHDSWFRSYKIVVRPCMLVGSMSFSLLSITRITLFL